MLKLIEQIVVGFVGLITSAVMIITGIISQAPERPVEVKPKTPASEYFIPRTEPSEKNEISAETQLPPLQTEGKNTKPETPVKTAPAKTSDNISPEPIETKIEITSPESDLEIETTENQDGSFDLIVTIPPATDNIPIDINKANAAVRGSIVNIICTTKQGGLLNPITGSGVFIDERGVILTNAHLAQYYLLKDYLTENFIDCTIRTGSPARNSYKADLLYISPTWIKNNFQKIASSNPKGTGESDFALLLVRDVTDSNRTIPNFFERVLPDVRDQKPKINQSVIVAGYPAGFLSSEAIQKDLFAVSTVTQVMDVFTFEKGTVDLFSIGGNIAAQKGSSGGAVVGMDGRLLGIVVTASQASETSQRDLRAITLSHIDKTLKRETGADLNGYLFGNLEAKARQFNDVVSPTLTSLLESALSN